MGCVHRSGHGRVMELRLECGDGIRIDSGNGEESSTQVLF